VRLSKVPNIIGVKEATGNLDRAKSILDQVDPSFLLYSGDDATAGAFCLLGGHGVISVTANVAPRHMHDLCAAARDGDAARVEAIDAKLEGLHRELFVESNPIPVKWALAEMGLIKKGIRLPLTWLLPAYDEVVRSAMRQAGAI
jgi:dihydrodipicolinate synthase/N-acetylneuraminate lyase